MSVMESHLDLLERQAVAEPLDEFLPVHLGVYELIERVRPSGTPGEARRTELILPLDRWLRTSYTLKGRAVEEARAGRAVPALDDLMFAICRARLALEALDATLVPAPAEPPFSLHSEVEDAVRRQVAARGLPRSSEPPAAVIVRRGQSGFQGSGRTP